MAMAIVAKPLISDFFHVLSIAVLFALLALALPTIDATFNPVSHAAVFE